jgi:hypothetical protein
VEAAPWQEVANRKRVRLVSLYKDSAGDDRWHLHSFFRRPLHTLAKVISTNKRGNTHM